MKLTFVGDPHGKIDHLVKIIKDCYYSIPRSQVLCVGDLGFNSQINQLKEELCFYTEHFFSVVGNHDDIPNKDSWPYLGNFAHFPNESIFTVRGAFSIDKIHRTEGIDWFANEELTYQEGLEAFDEYCKLKPRIVISHDCPESIRQTFFGIFEKSNTSNLLQAMFEEHQPELWVFGHHHKHRDSEIFGTRFICLEELETFEIDL